MKAILVIAVAVIGIAVSTHQVNGTLQTTPAQQYNVACIDYGNAVPCTLVR
jgi:hypothetical protein